MNKLLNENWDYIPESLEEVTSRYQGFGSEIFSVISKELPVHFAKLTFYRSTKYQEEDVFCICEGLGHDYAIQLDPDSEVICLWDVDTHIEIGHWSSSVYEESISFIKTNFG